MPNKETRTFKFDIELREDDKPVIAGHAAIFNEETDIGFFREKIAPGAFTDSIKSDDVRALFNHDPNHVLGRNIANTLKLSEDKEGLSIEIEPPDTQFARDLMVSMKRGDVDQMSFGFQVVKESWEEGEENQLDLRTLEQVRLFDVSPVTFPAYEGTDVAVRSHDQWQQSIKPHRAEHARKVLTLRKRGK